MRVLMLTGETTAQTQADGMRRAGVDVEIYVPASLKLRHIWRVRRDLRRFLKKQHFDVVHAQFAQGGALARGVWSGPLVVTINQPDVSVNAQQAPSLIGRFVWRKLGLFAARACDEAVLTHAALQQMLPRRPYHVLEEKAQSASALISIYQLARATHAAMLQ